MIYIYIQNIPKQELFESRPRYHVLGLPPCLKCSPRAGPPTSKTFQNRIPQVPQALALTNLYCPPEREFPM